ncbi:MAG: hypothetical protein E4H36_07650 [Spirochaetales bacterium]|nr:MAG: hypothetical protein E4H36_07650 [Spirochaetales bacterium]
MKKSFFLLSFGILLVLTVLLVLFLGFIGMLESLVRAMGLSAVIIIFLFGFTLLFFSLIDRRYKKELDKIIETLEIISRNRMDLTYRFDERGLGESASLTSGLNEFFSKLHNSVFKVKRMAEINRQLGGQMHKKIETLSSAFVTASENLGRILKDEQRNARNLHNAVNVLEEMKNLVNGIPEADIRSPLGSLRVQLEKAEKYLRILENTSLGTDASLDSFSRDFRDMLFGMDTLRSESYESGFYHDSIKVNTDTIETLDTTTLKSSDGIPLVIPRHVPEENPPEISDPRRPDDPAGFPEDDSRHWYDYEYAGWGVEKINQPLSPADGAEGKRVILLRLCSFEHPYFRAYYRGMVKMANAFGIELEQRSFSEKYEQAIQSVLAEKPDLLILYTEDAMKMTDYFKLINESGIPFIVGGSMPADDGMKYTLAACGSDDWGMGRMLAERMARLVLVSPGETEGYCILRHHPESQKYISRTFSMVTELKKICPDLRCLDMQPSLSREGSRMIVSEWLNRYGNSCGMILSSDPGECLTGMNEAIDKFRRGDILRGAIGNCLISQQFMKEKRLHMMVWESAEGEGAMALETAIDWLNGLDIPPIRYLPKRIITLKEVDNYFPAQW